MAGGDWEVRGLFGNEYALERAVDEIKKMEKPPQFMVLDRRNLQVVLSKNDAETKSLVRNIITIAHGWIRERRPCRDARKEEGGAEGQEAKGRRREEEEGESEGPALE